ncbi:MAG TPA: DUF1858 domain-containing protein [bacterium]|nr:DUF1858 domain-containing protein [bacterium]HOX86217.1 DUF1858 domain-containing protein [bacterium]HPG45569.1 DUF1858 domain-containing protein [bacterium]HPM97652.1 DUF1858 domain-containing protein [bacterium]
METDKLISPKTKVLQLIESYPHLEDTLIGYVPAFKKLKNPVLRKTVAKVATLQQAATIGNVKVEDLINALRKEAGQDAISLESDDNYTTTQPEWFDKSLVKKELDIREMLNAGEQPVNQVMAELNRLAAGDLFLVIAPFIPAPLIDKASSLEIEHWIDKKNDETFCVYFKK